MSPRALGGAENPSFCNRFGTKSTGFKLIPLSCFRLRHLEVNYNNGNYHVFKSPAPFSSAAEFDSKLRLYYYWWRRWMVDSPPSGGNGGSGTVVIRLCRSIFWNSKASVPIPVFIMENYSSFTATRYFCLC